MPKLSKNQLSILDVLNDAGGPMPASALEQKFTKSEAFRDDLAYLTQTAFITKKAKSVRITEIGLAALEPAPKPATKPEPKSIETKPKTKKARLIELLNAKDGVTVPVLAAALGWLPHTTRAALTGLKKDGLIISKLPPHEGGRVSRYTLTNGVAGEAA